MAAPSTLAQILLYLAAGTSALTLLGHIKMGHDVVFPSLKKYNAKDNGVISARIGWMECNLAFAIISVLCVKWGTFGCNDIFDKSVMGIYSTGQLYFGYCYMQNGIYEPLGPLWGVPALMGLSQLL